MVDHVHDDHYYYPSSFAELSEPNLYLSAHIATVMAKLVFVDFTGHVLAIMWWNNLESFYAGRFIIMITPPYWLAALDS